MIRKYWLLIIILVIFIMPQFVWASSVTVADEQSLREALESGQSVILANDIKITNKSLISTTPNRTVGIVITASELTIDGAGYKIYSDNIEAVLQIKTNTDTSQITLKNITIETTAYKGRCIDTRSKVNLVLTNSNFIATGTSSQAITLGGPEGIVSVDANKTSINAGNSGYAIIAFNPIKLNIANSVLTGYGVLYMKGKDNSEGTNGSVINVNSSNLNSVNIYNGISDNFGVIVLEDDNVKVNVTDSEILSSAKGDAISTVIIDKSTHSTQNEIIFSGEQTKILVEHPNKSVKLSYDNGGVKVRINDGVSFNIPVSEEYLPEDVTIIEDNQGNFVVAKYYNITIENPEYGTIIADKLQAIEGDIINLTVEANENYAINEIFVIDNAGNIISLNDGKFVMPKSDVKISVTYDYVKVNPETTSLNIGLYFVTLLTSFGGLCYIIKLRVNEN